ncbi:hypothetical protein CMV_026043 [Castanea mollissima]|uniref:Uncharacterized protein n=1 Tax=Castanea mollissima TaxID=60419 RepID=A0A8J4VAT7_9ROSI|nr:hypothetical protein CMV_026043 [Castanea mollissima]
MPANRLLPRGQYIKSLSKQTKAHAIHLRQNLTPFTSASFTPNLHRHRTDRRSRTISKKKEFSPCPLLPPLGLCRPLLVQTSTTPHAEAHCHRGCRSCREPRSKGGSTLADLQQALEDYLPVLLGLVKDGSHLQYKVQFVWVNQEDDAEETGMSNAW